MATPLHTLTNTFPNDLPGRNSGKNDSVNGVKLEKKRLQKCLTKIIDGWREVSREKFVDKACFAHPRGTEDHHTEKMIIWYKCFIHPNTLKYYMMILNGPFAQPRGAKDHHMEKYILGCVADFIGTLKNIQIWFLRALVK